MRTCPYCGKQTSDDVPFCTHCGAMLGSQSAQGQSAPQQSTVSTYRYSPSRGPKKNNAMIVLLITVVVLVAAFAGVSILSDYVKETPSTADHTMNYSWDFYYNDSGDHTSYTYTLTVPNTYYDQMEKTTIDRSGSYSDVHLTMNDGSTMFAVSEYIVVDEYIVKVSTDLRALYDADRSSGKIPSTTDFASFIMAFVQGSITYQTDGDYTGGKNSEYWKYPLETLCDKKGDCEDTSILIAALLDASNKSSDSSAKYSAGVFFLPEHAMGAVKATDISDPRKADNIRFDYYPIESTADSNKTYVIGSISDKYTGDYFHLYTGYSTSYYGVTFS